MPPVHLYFAAVAVPYLICIAAGLLLGHCAPAVRRLVLGCLWALMLCSECMKIAALRQAGTQPPFVPLHFSSTFHLSAGLALCARGKARHAGQVLLFTGGAIMTAMIAVSPVSVLGDLSLIFMSHAHAHGYFFHMSVAVQFFALLFSGEYEAEPLDGHIFAAFLLFWACLAVPGAFLLGVNYMGILQPYIPFFAPLLRACGYPLYLTIYYAAAVLPVWAFLRLFLLLQRRLRRKKPKNLSPVT